MEVPGEKGDDLGKLLEAFLCYFLCNFSRCSRLLAGATGLGVGIGLVRDLISVYLLSSYIPYSLQRGIPYPISTRSASLAAPAKHS